MMSTTLSSSGSPDSIKNELVSELSPKATAAAPGAAAAKTGKTKNRKRVNSAEKRSQHNAIERQRRETLNGKFVSLARLLPALAAVRRPSKSAIVNGSISHLNYQRQQRLLASKLLRQVCVQHDQLLEELNHWRSRAGLGPKDGPSVWTSDMDDICAVEKETFGVFSGEDGDAPDDDDETDVVNEASFDASMAASLTSLIDQRGSNDMEMANNFLMAQAAAAAAAISIPTNANQALSNANNNAAPLNWSRDFAFGSMSSSTSSLPFNAFMSDSIDHSSTSSPANSMPGNVLTPPEMGMYTHTPSPRSSLNDESARTANGFSEQQMMFLQSMQQPPAPAPVRQQSMPALGMPGANPFSQPPSNNNNQLGANNGATAMLNNLFAQSQMANAMNGGSDAFTQNLLAQMFPSQSHVPDDSVTQWRKLAMAGLNQNAMDSIPQSARTVRPSVLRSNSMWEQPVEGF